MLHIEQEDCPHVFDTKTNRRQEAAVQSVECVQNNIIRLGVVCSQLFPNNLQLFLSLAWKY